MYITKSYFLLQTVFSFYMAASASFKRARLKKCTTAFRFLVPLLFWLRNNGTMHSACSCLSEFLYTISLRDVGRRSHWHSPRILCSCIYRQRFTPGVYEGKSGASRVNRDQNVKTAAWRAGNSLIQIDTMKALPWNALLRDYCERRHVESSRKTAESRLLRWGHSRVSRSKRKICNMVR